MFPPISTFPYWIQRSGLCTGPRPICLGVHILDINSMINDIKKVILRNLLNPQRLRRMGVTRQTRPASINGSQHHLTIEVLIRRLGNIIFPVGNAADPILINATPIQMFNQTDRWELQEFWVSLMHQMIGKTQVAPNNNNRDTSQEGIVVTGYPMEVQVAAIVELTRIAALRTLTKQRLCDLADKRRQEEHITLQNRDMICGFLQRILIDL